MMAGLAQRLFCALLEAELGTTKEKSIELLKVMDSAGLVPMPCEPTGSLLDASIVAMKKSRKVFRGHPEKIQREKHLVRYRAMVEFQRQQLGLHERVGIPGAVGLAIEAVKVAQKDLAA